MLISLIGWILPPAHVAAAQTKTASLPEAYVEIKPYGPVKLPIQETRNRTQAPEAGVKGVHSPVDEKGRNSGRNNPPAQEKVSVQKAPTLPVYNGRQYSKEEVQGLITYYSQQFGINPAVPLCIARLESGYNQFSKNKASSASGVFQYLSGTWKATDEGKAGLSVFDADANVKAAIKYMASRKNTKPWTVGKLCPSL